MAENVLFGSEFDGKGISEGVNQVVVKLAEIRQAQKELRDETTRLNKTLDENQQELKQTQVALDAATKAGDPKKIKELSDQITLLTAKQKELTASLKDANVQQIVLQKGASVYSREIGNTVKNQTAINQQLEKFGSVNHLVGEGLGLFRRQVVDAGFALVSGFAGGIIASVLPALVSFVSSLIDAGNATDELKKKQDLQNSVAEDAAKSLSGQVTKLEAFRKVLNDLTVPEAERLRVAKEFNKTADEKNQIDTTQINNLVEINKQLDFQKEKLIQVALAAAATAKISEAAQPFLENSLKLRLAAQNLGISSSLLESNLKLFDKLSEAAIKTGQEARVGSIFTPEDAKRLNEFAASIGTTRAELFKLVDVFHATQKSKKELDDVTTALQDLITAGGVTGAGEKLQETTNVFLRELLRLQQGLSAAKGQLTPSASIIEEQFKEKLQTEINNINKFLDKKSREQVTPEQAAFLKSLAEKINALQLENSLEELRKKIFDLTSKLNDTINQEQTDNANKRIANIRDDFERERQQIDQGFTNTVAALTKARDNLLKQIDEAEKAGQDHATSQRQRILANSIFGDLVDQATVNKTNQQLDLTFKTFQNTLTTSNEVFEETLTQLDENIAKRIVAEKDNLASGAINYATFQKRVTALLKQQKEERDQIRKEELNSDLDQINIKLNATTDPEQVTKLQKQAREIRDQIANIDSNTETQKEDPVKKRIDTVGKYADSVGKLLTSVGQFWNQINQIEEKSLERSITLQEKRVEEARRIAERGNAEYLNQEQDRLDQLELKREASARKQQAINSALVLSQALVATVSAIAQAASTSGPAAPFAAIAAGIAVIGAITAAFQFVNSLQPPVATFRHGVEEVQVGQNKPGIDTVPARLTAGERVVTVRENKEYFETLTAIHNRKVSPEVLNSFVRKTLTGQKEGQGEIRLSDKQVEHYRETVLKDRLTKEDRQLSKEIANQVSFRIINNTEKEQVFNYVEHILTDRFHSNPVIVPKIMTLIREQVTEKQASSERTIVKDVSSALDSFSERIEVVQKVNQMERVERIRTNEIIRELTKVMMTGKDHETLLTHVEKQLTSQITNPETAKLLIPVIKEKLTNNVNKESKTVDKDSLKYVFETSKLFNTQRTDQVTKIIERFADKVNKSDTEKVIQQVFRDQFIKEHSDYKETIEAIFDKRIESTRMNEFVRTVTKEATQQNTLKEILQTKQITNQVLKASQIEIPVISYQRLEQATHHSTEVKGLVAEQIRIMKENTELQKENNKILKTMGFAFNFDRNGVSAMFMKYQEQQKIDLKT